MLYFGRKKLLLFIIHSFIHHGFHTLKLHYRLHYYASSTWKKTTWSRLLAFFYISFWWNAPLRNILWLGRTHAPDRKYTEWVQSWVPSTFPCTCTTVLVYQVTWTLIESGWTEPSSVWGTLNTWTRKIYILGTLSSTPATVISSHYFLLIAWLSYLLFTWTSIIIGLSLIRSTGSINNYSPRCYKKFIWLCFPTCGYGEPMCVWLLCTFWRLSGAAICIGRDYRPNLQIMMENNKRGIKIQRILPLNFNLRNYKKHELLQFHSTVPAA